METNKHRSFLIASMRTVGASMFQRWKSVPAAWIAMLLILSDQLVKILVYRHLMTKEFDLLGDFVVFKPKLNTDYSWLNAVSQAGVGFWPHVLLNVAILLAAIVAFDFIGSRFADGGKQRLLRFLSSLLYAGVSCALIDKIFWGGSLDYIGLKGLFIFDLKDAYLTIFEAVILLAVALNYRRLKAVDGKALYKDFKSYIKLRLDRSRR